jgi:hypothetical protein
MGKRIIDSTTLLFFGFLYFCAVTALRLREQHRAAL